MRTSRGCWSSNTASGYADTLNRCLGQLENAVKALTVNQVDEAQRCMTAAQKYMDEADRWFERSNVEAFRVEALVAEVKALRHGQAVSYPSGADPVEDTWTLPQVEEPPHEK